MNRIIIIVLFVILGIVQGISQVTLARWDFNGSSATVNEAITNNAGKQLASSQSFSYNAGSGGGNAASASGWNNGGGTKYWEVEINTTGYASIKVSSEQKGSNTGPQNFKLQYRVGSTGAFTDIAGATVSMTNENWANYGKMTDIALPTAAEDNSSIFIRWLMVDNTSIDNGGTASGGNSRIDNILVTGVVACVKPATPAGTIATVGSAPFCGNSISFTHSGGTAPSGIVYYWQTTATGTSTSSSLTANPTYTLSGTGVKTAYLRAYRTTGGCWSDNAISASGTVYATPGFSAHPGNKTVVVGINNTNVTFTATASGTVTSRQWQISVNNGATWTNLTNTAPYSGVTTATLTISTAPDSFNGNRYRMVAGNSGCTINSNAAILTVSTVKVSPIITVQTAVQYACNSIKVEAEEGEAGGHVLNYVWYVNTPGASGWTALTDGGIYSGATTNELYVTSLTGLEGYQFYCRVMEDGATCYTASNAARVVTPPTGFVYQTIASGNWSDPEIWEVSGDGTSWEPACTYPRASNSTEATIQSGHEIALDLGVDIDLLTIDGELTMLLANQLSVLNGASGADLIVNGTLIDRNEAGAELIFSASTWILGTNGTVVKTNNAAVAQYQAGYEGGMSTIPSSSKWIYRSNGDGDPVVGTEDWFYPNLYFEKESSGNHSFELTGSAGFATIKGILYIGETGDGTVTVTNNNSNAQPMKILDDLHINTGSALETLTGTGFEVEGSVNVQGKLGILSGTEKVLRFSGNKEQQVRGSGILDVFKLEINKTAADVLLECDLKAQSELKMVSGNIMTQANMLELGQSAIQKGTLSYTSGFVVGTMRRWFNGTNSGNSSGLFPMGVDDSGVKNRNVSVEYTTAPTDGGSLTVNFVNSDMGMGGIPILTTDSGTDFDVTSTEADGYWQINNEPGNLIDGEYQITCTGEGFETITDISLLTLLKRVGGGDWLCPGIHNTPTGTTDFPMISRSGVTGWSNFGFGGGTANPLPVELVSFSVSCEGNAKLSWSTASEQNAAYFAVEKTTDGIHWKEIGQISAQGNSSHMSHYTMEDVVRGEETIYYRLSQFDFNGTRRIYNPVSLDCKEKAFEVNVFPNPNNGHFSVLLNTSDFSGQVSLLMTTADGKLIEQRELVSDGGSMLVEFNQNELKSGIYFVTVRDGFNHGKTIKVSVD